MSKIYDERNSQRDLEAFISNLSVEGLALKIDKIHRSFLEQCGLDLKNRVESTSGPNELELKDALKSIRELLGMWGSGNNPELRDALASAVLALRKVLNPPN
ncbi:MAG: hypothetical protein WC897_03095 [Candidatus Gracilibacteria bacterium]